MRIGQLELVDPVVVEFPRRQAMRTTWEEEEHDYCLSLLVDWLREIGVQLSQIIDLVTIQTVPPSYTSKYQGCEEGNNEEGGGEDFL